MKKIALLLANGFEEIEALAPVDVLRRAQFEVDMVGLTSHQVVGSHGITVIADKIFAGDLSAYDMVILPGGMPGAVNLRDHEELIQALQIQAQKGSYIGAICAAPIVLDKAGLLEGRNFTCFPGKEKEITFGRHVESKVVVDGPIVTSRGAGTSLDFAYTLVDLLGSNGKELSETMVYDH
ncbi:DJ-1/PfpI family protein [Streptococcus suis]|nr:DJ-1/PfpI family protein [Streptococcus suis]MBY5020868.1 DJ-1/PfpI family protein [Streptococcus suis]